MIKMSKGISYRRGIEAMEVDDELADLAHPSSLPKPAKTEPKEINLLSTNSGMQPLPHTNPDTFPLLVDWMVFHPSVELWISLQDHKDNYHLKSQIFMEYYG